MREPGANDELLSLIIVSRFFKWQQDILFQLILTHAYNQDEQLANQLSKKLQYLQKH